MLGKLKACMVGGEEDFGNFFFKFNNLKNTLKIKLKSLKNKFKFFFRYAGEKCNVSSI